MLAGNYTPFPRGCLSTPALPERLNFCLAKSVGRVPNSHMVLRVLPFSHTNLAQFGFVIRNVVLFGGHDDPASKALLAKCLCTREGSHTYKRCSSQPSYMSLRSKGRKARPPWRREWQLTASVENAQYHFTDLLPEAALCRS